MHPRRLWVVRLGRRVSRARSYSYTIPCSRPHSLLFAMSTDSPQSLFLTPPSSEVSASEHPQQPAGPHFRPTSLVAAMLFPGLGHFIAGERTRGLLVATGVLGLFFGGMFIGGIDVIDSKEDRIWFFGQACIGPIAVGVDWTHQNRFKVIDPESKKLRSANPDEGRAANGLAFKGGEPPNRKSINKVNDLGTLYATLAGMMNLIVILDAGWPSRRRIWPVRKPGGGVASEPTTGALLPTSNSVPTLSASPASSSPASPSSPSSTPEVAR